MTTHRVQGLWFVAICLLVGGTLAFAMMPNRISGNRDAGENIHGRAEIAGPDKVDPDYAPVETGDDPKDASQSDEPATLAEGSVFTTNDFGTLTCVSNKGREFPVSWDAKSETAKAHFGNLSLDGTITLDWAPASNTVVHSIEFVRNEDSHSLTMNISDDGTITAVLDGETSYGHCRRAS